MHFEKGAKESQLSVVTRAITVKSRNKEVSAMLARRSEVCARMVVGVAETLLH
jgi:hypothetical protein